MLSDVDHIAHCCRSSLAPGARTLLQSLTDTALPRSERINLAKRPRDLNIAEWALVLRAFDNWPFKPAVSVPLGFPTVRTADTDAGFAHRLYPPR